MEDFDFKIQERVERESFKHDVSVKSSKEQTGLKQFDNIPE
jgi:hypothetical protein